MSVLVKGIRMPQNCMMCWMSCICDVYIKNNRKYEGYENRMEGCQLVDVQEHHGRLIDADELNRKLIPQWDRLNELDFANKALWRTLDNMPTIIDEE